MYRKKASTEEIKELEKLFSKLRISNVDIHKTLRDNAKIVSNLSTVIEEARLKRGCAESMGQLIYMVAQKFPSNALMDRPTLLRYITSSKIKTCAQLDAAYKFLSTKYSRKPSIDDFEKACGVGHSEEEVLKIIKDTVDEIYEQMKDDTSSIGNDLVVSNHVKKYVQKRLPWADESICMDYISNKLNLSEQIEAKKSRDKGKEKYVETASNDESREKLVRAKVDGVNIEEGSVDDFILYGEKIISEIAKLHHNGKLFVLPSHEEVKDHPFVPMRIYTNAVDVIYIVAKDTLYVVGYKPSTEGVVRVFKPKEQTKEGKLYREKNPPLDSHERLRQLEAIIEKMPVFQGQNPKIIELPFQETYNNLQNSANVREKIPLGKHQLMDAVHTLCRSNAKPDAMAKALIVSLEMLSEVLRFLEMKEFVRSNYSDGKAPDPNLVELQNNWGKLSKLLLNWLKTGEDFEIEIGNTKYKAQEALRSVLVAKFGKEKDTPKQGTSKCQ